MAKFCYFIDMANNFLHSVNLEMLEIETDCDIKQLSNAIGISPQTMYKWNRDKEDGGCRPTYDCIAKLIERGATTESLFGVEYKAGIKVVEKPVSQEQIMDGVRKALADLGKGL